LPQQRKETGLKPNELYDKEHSFFDGRCTSITLANRANLHDADDLPVIKKNIEQGFRETQLKVNKWVGDFIKKLDGEPEEYDNYGNPLPGPATKRWEEANREHGPQYGGRRSAEQRRSADRERYDTDNRVLGDDFDALELRDEEGMSHFQGYVAPRAY
jgi:hypothetical protein